MPIFPAWNSYTSRWLEITPLHAYRCLPERDSRLRYRRGLCTYAQERYELPENREEYLDGKGRRGLDSYLKYGYIPLEDHIDDAFHKNEQVSRTLEYAFDDAMLVRWRHF